MTFSATTIYLSICISFVITFYSCNNSNPANYRNSSQEITPLTKGNSWYYAGTSFDTLGNVRVYFNLWYSRRYYYVWEKFTPYSGIYVINTDSGLVAYRGYSVSYKNDTTVIYELLYKYPSLTGQIFGNKMKAGSIDTVLTVQAGIFHCINYLRYNDDGILGYSAFVSPGIGLIKAISFFGAYYSKNPLSVSTYFELKSYKLYWIKIV